MKDMLDITLHAAAAILIVVALSLATTPIWFAVFINTVLWPGRELAQDIARGRGLRPWSLQKHLEAWPPVLCGAVAGLILHFAA